MSIYPQRKDVDIQIGDDYHQRFYLGVDITDCEVTFTMKASKYDDNADSKMVVTLSGGLTILNGAVASDPSWASITSISDLAGTVDLDIDNRATAELLPSYGNWYFDFQVEDIPT